jgi:hypothetical protein
LKSLLLEWLPTTSAVACWCHQAGETGEQLVLRLTRAWNVALRERPHQEQLWLDYVAWQEEAARLLGGRR